MLTLDMVRLLLIYILLIIGFVNCEGSADKSQKAINGPRIPEDTTHYCDKMPELKIGWDKYAEYINAHLNYDSITDAKGKVFVKFIVTKKGDVENPLILKGLSKSTNDECIRVVRLLKFNPAIKNKEPLTVYFSVAIKIDSTNYKKHNR